MTAADYDREELGIPAPGEPFLDNEGEMRFPVKFGNKRVLCKLDDDGYIVVPVVGMNIELTGIIEGLLKEAGIPSEDIEATMDKLRVQYVMGRDVTVEEAKAKLDADGADGGEDLHG